MIPHEPSARLRMLYAEHVQPERNGRPSMSLESHLHAVRHAREWGLRRQLLADASGWPPTTSSPWRRSSASSSTPEQELGVERRL